MEWIIGFVLIALLIVIFVVLQLIGILFLLDENKKIAEELEKNSPPFWFDKTAEMRLGPFYNNLITLWGVL